MAGNEESSGGALHCEEEVNELPREIFWNAMEIRKWEGFWMETGLLKSAIRFKHCFKATNDDVLLASCIKTGTTWLKALCLCILQENQTPNDDVLTKDSPQFHVQTVESSVYTTKPHSDLYTAPSPRLFHTHLPYTLLPDSAKTSACKLVYITRNPKDTLVSMWHFFNNIFKQPYPIHKAVEVFCNGVYHYGPFFDNVVEYWTESKKRPEKILFLRYEDLKRDPKVEVRRLATFLGKELSDERVEEVLRRCSLERLRELEVNKSGCVVYGVPNSSYFRKGIIGDWKNWLTHEMEEMIDETSRVKLQGSGLNLES